MKRTLKVVLVYLAVIALGWLDQSRGQENAAEPTTSAGQVVPNTAAVDQVVPGGAGRVAAAAGKEPDWSPIVIPRGEYREYIKSMPIEERPYRPLHFYGNTIRRNHYRGNPLPMPRDLGKTAIELIRPR